MGVRVSLRAPDSGGGATAANEDRVRKRALFTHVRTARERQRARVRAIYAALFAAFGPQGWWPAETPFETLVGAVLAQRTSWRNAEAALKRLKEAGLLHTSALAAVDLERLEELVRPSGFYRRKARTLAALLARMQELPRGFDDLMALDARALRSWLLSTKGVGPETADTIVLYARGLPSFVVDAYTKRFATRHGLAGERSGYDELKRFFERTLPGSSATMNEFHALLVRLGKDFCRPRPRCEGCPLRWDLPADGPGEPLGATRS